MNMKESSVIAYRNLRYPLPPWNNIILIALTQKKKSVKPWQRMWQLLLRQQQQQQ